MKASMIIALIALSIFSLTSCKKNIEADDVVYQYYEVGFNSVHADWRDTAFIVRTSNQQLIQQIEAQLSLPFVNRKLVTGALVAGSGGYNKNASHEFKWHFKEDDWQLTDMTVEIYDGRPYSDVDVQLTYWLNNVKRFGSWGSFIKRKLPGKP
jgi:hypothetical protein